MRGQRAASLLVVFFEEAQNLLGTHKVKDNKDNIFIRTFKEGRALAIGTTSVTQQPSALSRDLTSQIAYYLIATLTVARRYSGLASHGSCPTGNRARH